MNAKFTADTSGTIVKRTFDESETAAEEIATTEKSVDIDTKAIRKFFNVMVHNYDISFWDTDLCREISYDPDIDLLPEYRDDDLDDLEGDDFIDCDDSELPDDRVPSWSVEIMYKNGTEQKTKGYDFIPDPVMELFDDFEGYFSDEDLLDDEFDE